jgi:hypothetical protein
MELVSGGLTPPAMRSFAPLGLKRRGIIAGWIKFPAKLSSDPLNASGLKMDVRGDDGDERKFEKRLGGFPELRRSDRMSSRGREPLES